MLNFDEEVLTELACEYGVDTEFVKEVVEAANSFQFIPDDEERSNFVEGVLLTYITGNTYRSNYPENVTLTDKGVTGRELRLGALRTLGTIIADAAHDGYDHYITPYDEADIARVRTKYEDQ